LGTDFAESKGAESPHLYPLPCLSEEKQYSANHPWKQTPAWLYGFPLWSILLFTVTFTGFTPWHRVRNPQAMHSFPFGSDRFSVPEHDSDLFEITKAGQVDAHLILPGMQGREV
jgi:hypothetical protein